MERLEGSAIPEEFSKMLKLPPAKRPLLSITARVPSGTTAICALRLNSFVSLLDDKGQVEKLTANFFTENNPPLFSLTWHASSSYGILSVDSYHSRYTRTIWQRIKGFLSRTA